MPQQSTPPSSANGGSRPWLNIVREREVRSFAHDAAVQDLNTCLLSHNQQDYTLYHAQKQAMNAKVQQATGNPLDSAADQISVVLNKVISEVTALPTPHEALADLRKGDLRRYLPDPVKGTGIHLPEYENLMSGKLTPQEKTAVDHAIGEGLALAHRLLQQDAATLSRYSAGRVPSAHGRGTP